MSDPGLLCDRGQPQGQDGRVGRIASRAPRHQRLRAVKARSSGAYPYPGQAAWAADPSRGYLGSGVTVGIIDSGVDDAHPALAGKFVAGYDAFTQTGGPGVNRDDDFLNWYHGTAVAGIIMGNDPAQQYMGGRSAAGLVECKIFNSTGQSQASYAVARCCGAATARPVTALT